MSIYKRLNLNRYLVSGALLCVPMFLIYVLKYDYLLTFGPFVAHHFIELPAVFLLGMGLSMFFSDSGFSALHSQVLNASIVAAVILLDFFMRGVGGLIASSIVLSPELLGFYLHRAKKVKQP